MRSDMKKWIFALILGAFVVLPSCKKGPSCPAYGGLHSKGTPTYATTKDKTGDNKKEIEKQKDQELAKPPKRKNAYSLFPQGMR